MKMFLWQISKEKGTNNSFINCHSFQISISIWKSIYTSPAVFLKYILIKYKRKMYNGYIALSIYLFIIRLLFSLRIFSRGNIKF